MANRRFRSNHSNYGGINPWEGGSFPGNYNPNVISQLNEPQTQLAIALTKLLQPQSSALPSLLSMDTVNPSNSFNYPMNRSYDRRNRDFRRDKVCFSLIWGSF